MAFTTGQVRRFHNVAITADETIGTGNGSTTVFNGYNLVNRPVFVNTVVIKFTIGAVQKTVTADASGTFTHADLASGSVTDAGVINLTFNTAPDNATLIFVDSYTCKGVLQKVIDFVTTNKFTHNLGTGNGSTTNFAVTLSNTTVAKGQCRVKVKIATIVYDIWDNGNGAFVHPLISSGTINYATGEVDITFTIAPDNAYVMVILYTTGADGRDWLLMVEQNTKNNAGTPADAFSGQLLKEVVLKNSGPSFLETIVVGLREWKHTTPIYGWNLVIHKIWGESQETMSPPRWNGNSAEHAQTSYDGTTNNWSQLPMIPFDDNVMTYWIYSNKRRIIVVIKVSATVYVSIYLGQGIRFASPSRYALPSIAIGNSAGNTLFSSTASTFVFIANPPNGIQIKNWMLLLPDNTFLNNSLGSHSKYMLPEVTQTGSLEKANNNTDHILYPLYAFENEPIQQLLFQIDGVYLVPGTGLASEDTISQGGNTYRVFQNVFRTSQYDYMCVLES